MKTRSLLGPLVLMFSIFAGGCDSDPTKARIEDMEKKERASAALIADLTKHLKDQQEKIERLQYTFLLIHDHEERLAWKEMAKAAKDFLELYPDSPLSSEAKAGLEKAEDALKKEMSKARDIEESKQRELRMAEPKTISGWGYLLRSMPKSEVIRLLGKPYMNQIESEFFGTGDNTEIVKVEALFFGEKALNETTGKIEDLIIYVTTDSQTVVMVRSAFSRETRSFLNGVVGR